MSQAVQALSQCLLQPPAADATSTLQVGFIASLKRNASHKIVSEVRVQAAVLAVPLPCW